MGIQCLDGILIIPMERKIILLAPALFIVVQNLMGIVFGIFGFMQPAPWPWSA